MPRPKGEMKGKTATLKTFPPSLIQRRTTAPAISGRSLIRMSMTASSAMPCAALPRMLAEFHLGEVTGYDIRILPDTGDPVELVKDVLKQVTLPPKAKITALVCNGRSRPKLVKGWPQSKFSAGKAS